MENPHKGHRERLKNRFRREGLAGFNEHEVLELILMYSIPVRDVNGLAHGLINEFGSLAAVMNADYGQLVRFGGVGVNSATLIRLIKEATQYANLQNQSRPELKMNNSQNAGSYCAQYIGGSKTECVALLSLGADMRLIRSEILQSGSFSQAPVYARGIAETAIKNNAAAVILSHNHPSGVLKPSQNDVETTISLNKALAVLDICLADHIIVCGGQYYSMFANRHFTHEEAAMQSRKLASDLDAYK